MHAYPPVVPLRFGFLASHGGSGMRAVVDACRAGALRAIPGVLITNNVNSEAMVWAQACGVSCVHLSGRTHPSPVDLDRAITEALVAAGANLIVLSGYMRKLGPEVLARFGARILNVHPALLPRHGGQGMYGDRVHAHVLSSGDTTSGATVHLVDREYDTGPIVAQQSIPVLDGDTIETLGQRVRSAEQTLLVATLRGIEAGEIDLDRVYRSQFLNETAGVRGEDPPS